jgi:putative DNA methylase
MRALQSLSLGFYLTCLVGEGNVMKGNSDKFVPKGWHSRGYLPHFDGGVEAQFVTFRLNGSLSQKLLDKWREDLAREVNIDAEAALRRRIELYLDKGYGDVYLKDERVAKIVEDALLYHDDLSFYLSAWVVMPNHIHFLATQCEGIEWSYILHSIKSYTASEANKILHRRGRFWQKEAFDRFIRDSDHFAKVVVYIENNPVKAGLCKRPSEWRFSSAWWRAQLEEKKKIA